MIPNIFYAAIGICFSISLFNWCGLAVTQSISATSRSTIGKNYFSEKEIFVPNLDTTLYI